MYYLFSVSSFILSIKTPYEDQNLLIAMKKILLTEELFLMDQKIYLRLGTNNNYCRIKNLLLFNYKLEGDSMVDENIKVDVKGETCPVPLVEARKALKKASPGDIVEIIGTHPASKKEIPMAVEALGLEIVDIQEKEGVWKIKIRR